jgi:hypothetical protein
VAHLLGENGSLAGSNFPIDPGITLGREAHNTVAMPSNRRCSRDHAKVWREAPGRYAIADLGSTNGTLVNDEPITRAVLKDGDEVRIGDEVFRFHLDEGDRPKASAPAAAAARPNLADALRSGVASRPAPGAPPAGPGEITVKQRILQYRKKGAGGSQLGWDVGQTAGPARWIMLLAALGVAAALYVVVSTLVAS